MKHWIVAVTAVWLVGCTTHMETRSSDATHANAIVGVPYALPFVSHELTVTRTLVDCQIGANGEIEKLEFEANVEHKPRYVPGERFVVDYRALGNWHKTSGFKLTTYANQTLKTVNADADDRSPEIIGATVKTALTVARIATASGWSDGGSVRSAMAEVRKSNLTSDTQDVVQRALDSFLVPALPECPAEVAEMKIANDVLKDKSDKLLAQTRKRCTSS